MSLRNLFSTVPTAGALVLSALACNLHAGDTVPDLKPVPRAQVIPLPNFQASFQLEGRELTRFHFDPQKKRPFWYPVQTTLAPSLVRMGHPHSPEGHRHHYGLWMTHMAVNGVDFWVDDPDDGKEKVRGTVRHQKIIGFWDDDKSAAMMTLIHWVADRDNQVLLIERRRMEVRPMPDATSWMMIVDSEFTAPKGRKATFGPTGHGLMSARVAKTISVEDGGGRLLNSEGQINEREVFRQPAKWCDFSGRLTNNANGLGGITLLNHPDNPNHPTAFHVRDEGCMFACLSLVEPVVVGDAQPMRVRCGVWVHEGMPTKEQCEAMWRRFAALPLPDTNLKP